MGWFYGFKLHLVGNDRGEILACLLKGRLRAALLRLNEWLTEEQAERVIFELEHVNEVGIARNQKIHEYLTFGLPLTINTAHGQDSRNVRFFDFERPDGGLNELVLTTQFRVRRSSEKSDDEDDQRVIKPDLVLFVNGIPLVVMEAKSPSLLDVWKSQAVRQLRPYQEAGPEFHGTGAPELFHYNLLCVAHCGANAAYAATGAPENAYFQWKSVAPYSGDEVRERFGVEPLDLQTVLKQGGGRTVMTTIQKFEESLTTTDGKLDVLSDSGNVFIMVDERAPHPVRRAGQPEVPGPAQRGDDRLHRHAHRQGLRPQHHEALRPAH